MDEKPDRLLSVAQVAERLNAKPATVRLWIREGRLPAIKVGPRLWRVAETDLAAFLRQR